MLKISQSKVDLPRFPLGLVHADVHPSVYKFPDTDQVAM